MSNCSSNKSHPVRHCFVLYIYKISYLTKYTFSNIFPGNIFRPFRLNKRLWPNETYKSRDSRFSESIKCFMIFRFYKKFIMSYDTSGLSVYIFINFDTCITPNVCSIDSGVLLCTLANHINPSSSCLQAP